MARRAVCAGAQTAGLDRGTIPDAHTEQQRTGGCAMSYISKVLHRRTHADAYLDHPPFPLAGAALGLIAVVNVASTMAVLLTI